MKQRMPPLLEPPPWLVRLIEACLPRTHREHITGDLVEDFTRHAGRADSVRAWLTLLRGALSAVWSLKLLSVRETILDHSSTRTIRMQGVTSDLRQALRVILRAPGFAAVCIATLGVGIGATATMCGVVERLLLRGPEHVAQPERVLRIYAVVRHRPAGLETGGITGYATYTAVRDHTDAFDVVAAYQSDTWVVGTGAEATRLPGTAASADFFPLAGVHPVLGRFYTRTEDTPNASSDVVVLAHEYWKAAFAGDRDVIGRRLTIAFRPFTIIGVAPPGFTGVERQPVDFWIPLSSGAHPRPDWPTTWQARWLEVVARLRRGVSVDRASSEATAAFRHAYTGSDPDWRVATVSLRPISYTTDGVEPAIAPVARWLTAVAVIVLLISCANVANLLLARAVRRRRELAVRTALGMNRNRLFQLLLAEGVGIALASGIIGAVLAYAGSELLRRFFLTDVAWTTGFVDPIVLLAATSLSLVVAVLISLVPFLHVHREDLASALKSGVREGGGQRLNTRAALVLLQTTLTVILLVGAGLFVRSLMKVQALDLGIQTDRVLAASIYWPAATEPQNESQRQIWQRLRDSIAARPEFEDASVAIGSPFRSAMGVPVKVPGWDSLPRLGGGGPFVIAVGRDYFRTVGTPILLGRGFRPNEGAASERVVIINETMARTLWPQGDPLGKCVLIGGGDTRCSTVVGVVPEAHRFGIQEEPAMQCYLPLGQEAGISGITLLARPRQRVGRATGVLRHTLAALAPGARFIDVAPLQDLVDVQIRPWRLGAAMFGLFGALALLVAASGLYSLIAYVVAQRRHEFGVRLALGATSIDVLRLVLGQGVRVVALGCLVASGAAMWAGGRLESQLFDESGRDPLVYAIVIVTMLVVSILACIIPATRASLLDPAATLRAE